MHTIEVDFAVLKELMARRETEAVTYNDVLRHLLGMDKGDRKIGSAQGSVVVPGQGAWVSKGVSFPSGTEFRANYKGRTHSGRVNDGVLFVNGKSYDSPSAAAVAITGSPVNGWTFWECRRPGETRWQVLKGLRSAV